MRAADEQPGSMLSYVSLEERIPRGSSPAGNSAHHRSRPGPPLAAARAAVCPFRAPVEPTEELLRALLLQALYTIRCERQVMEQLDYNLLFRWFVGPGIDDAVWAAIGCWTRDIAARSSTPS
jgi:hypothetical protein